MIAEACGRLPELLVRREIGVRLALGATRPRILRMFLRQGAALVVVGLVLGAVIAMWAGRLVKSSSIR